MKEATVGITKEKGYLYYVDKKGDISRSKMARSHTTGARGPPEKIAIVGVKKINGRLYYVDKQGDVSSSPATRGRAA